MATFVEDHFTLEIKLQKRAFGTEDATTDTRIIGEVRTFTADGMMLRTLAQDITNGVTPEQRAGAEAFMDAMSVRVAALLNIA